MRVSAGIFIVVNAVLQFANGLVSYKGFDACGFDGWHCKASGTDLEVSFECNEDIRDARLWLWTARIPQSTTILAVRHCQRVELHMDCTMGYRAYTLKRFQAENITQLELLTPLRPHIFLHDNDMFSQAPPELVFSDIKMLKWTQDSFKLPGGRCRTYKQGPFQRFVLNNVYLNSWSGSLFREQNLKLLILINTTFGSISPGLLTVDGNVVLTGLHMPAVLDNCLSFKCKEMMINGSTFGDLRKGSITVTSKYFSFINNEVDNVEKNSFQISAQAVRFVNNTMNSMASDAFSAIKPDNNCDNGNWFEFRENKISQMDGTFLPDVTAYKEGKCAHIEVVRNIFPCDQSCALSQGITHLNYHEIVKATNTFTVDNTCQGIPNKTVEAAVLDVAIACGIVPTPTEPETTTVTEPSTSTSSAPPTTLKTSALYRDEEKTGNEAAKSSHIAVPLSVGAVLLLAAGLSTLFWVYRKRNAASNKPVATFQQSSGNFDHETLINSQEDDEDHAVTFNQLD